MPKPKKHRHTPPVHLPHAIGNPDIDEALRAYRELLAEKKPAERAVDAAERARIAAERDDVAAYAQQLAAGGTVDAKETAKARKTIDDANKKLADAHRHDEAVAIALGQLRSNLETAVRENREKTYSVLAETDKRQRAKVSAIISELQEALGELRKSRDAIAWIGRFPSSHVLPKPQLRGMRPTRIGDGDVIGVDDVLSTLNDLVSEPPSALEQLPDVLAQEREIAAAPTPAGLRRAANGDVVYVPAGEELEENDSDDDDDV